MDVSELTLDIGGTHTLSATVTPDDTVDKTVTYSSSDTSVATVTPKLGKVTAVSAGTATITATTVNNIKGTVSVTVNEPVVDEG